MQYINLSQLIKLIEYDVKIFHNSKNKNMTLEYLLDVSNIEYCVHDTLNSDRKKINAACETLKNVHNWNINLFIDRNVILKLPTIGRSGQLMNTCILSDVLIINKYNKSELVEILKNTLYKIKSLKAFS